MSCVVCRVGLRKCKLVLFLIERHAMKMYWEVEVYLHTVLTSALDGSEWSASLPGLVTPYGKNS